MIIKFEIPMYTQVEYLKDVSVYNLNYYKINNHGDTCIIYFDNNIVREICHEEENYYEYDLGHFENDKFVPILSWTSEYGEDSIFSEVEE